jgi:hypothetical protein
MAACRGKSRFTAIPLSLCGAKKLKAKVKSLKTEVVTSMAQNPIPTPGIGQNHRRTALGSSEKL